MLDQPLEQPALLGRQLAVLEAHVAQEDDVVLRKLVEPGGELLDVVLVAAARPCSGPGWKSRHDSSTPGSRERALRR